MRWALLLLLMWALFASEHPITSASSCKEGFYASFVFPGIPGPQAKCPIGYYCPNGDCSKHQCQLRLGKFQDLTKQTSCKSTASCSYGQYQVIAPTFTSNRVCGSCQHGTYMDEMTHAHTSCKLCSSGYFQDLAGQPNCKECSLGKYQPLLFSTSCLNCPAGTYNSVTAATSLLQCLSCAQGKYADLAGSSTCKSASKCSYGERVGSNPTLSSDRICVACNGDTYMDEERHTFEACKPDLLCHKGEYQSTFPTSSSNRKCSACTEGKYEDEETHTYTTCKNPSLCGVGYHESHPPTLTSDRQCRKCFPGKYMDNDNSEASCKSCSLGTSYQDLYSQGSCKDTSFCTYGEKQNAAPTTSSDRGCTTCDKGKYMDQEEHTTTSCKPPSSCSMGTFVSATYTISSDRVCSPCPTATYMDETNHRYSSCKATSTCTSGEYQSVEPTITTDRTCDSCLAGKYRSDPVHTMSTCDDCMIGKFSQMGARLCSNCNAGTFQNNPGSMFCKQCRICTQGFSDTGGCNATVDRECTDITPPTIVLMNPATNATISGNAYFVSANKDFVPPVAFAEDTAPGEISLTIPSNDVVQNIDTSNTTGPFSMLTYTAIDANQVEGERSIFVVPVNASKPSIVIEGPSVLILEAGIPWSLSNLTSDVKILNDGVFLSNSLLQVIYTSLSVGNNTVIYHFNDTSDRGVADVSRLVRIIDSLPPVLSVDFGTMVFYDGEWHILHEGATPFVMPTISAYDIFDKQVSANDVVVSGDVIDVMAPAGSSFSIVFSVQDSSSNVAEKRFAIDIVDNTPPAVTLVGAQTIFVEVGEMFVDQGATALDSLDGMIDVEVIRNLVNVNAVMSFQLEYEACDKSKNCAQKKRIVRVRDTTPPVIWLTGNTSVFVMPGEMYQEFGYFAEDGVDGELTAAVVVSGLAELEVALNASKPGAFTLTYTVKDLSGNSATATRTVRILEVVEVVPVDDVDDDDAADDDVSTQLSASSSTVTIEIGAGVGFCVLLVFIIIAVLHRSTAKKRLKIGAESRTVTVNPLFSEDLTSSVEEGGYLDVEPSVMMPSPTVPSRNVDEEYGKPLESFSVGPSRTYMIPTQNPTYGQGRNVDGDNEYVEPDRPEQEYAEVSKFVLASPTCEAEYGDLPPTVELVHPAPSLNDDQGGNDESFGFTLT
eukprot:m.133083 g.133083  ORF g.133083 m.133083 type:complete len:1163 (+) comp9491_c0_seq3:175-3663(+)